MPGSVIVSCLNPIHRSTTGVMWLPTLCTALDGPQILFAGLLE